MQSNQLLKPEIPSTESTNQLGIVNNVPMSNFFADYNNSQSPNYIKLANNVAAGKCRCRRGFTITREENMLTPPLQLSPLMIFFLICS